MSEIVPAVAPAPGIPRRKSRAFRYTKKAFKRIVPAALMIYFLPWVLLAYVVCGLLDFSRNRQRNFRNLDRYFAGNGVFTWLLSPFNLFMDLLTLPYINKGIYRLHDLPAGHQAEINALIEAAGKRDLIAALQAKMGEKKRGMIFFQWYGKLIPSTVDIPEFCRRYKYIRTIGVSIFNKRQSTGKHFGPLRVTLRVLYNVNPIDDPNVYIKVGNYTHPWRDQQLFIFDDTLQHESHNDSDAQRYCLFVDILRPSLAPAILSGILTGIRIITAPFRAVFYKHWTFFK